MAMMASGTSGTPYENNDAVIEQDLIEPDDGIGLWSFIRLENYTN